MSAKLDEDYKTRLSAAIIQAIVDTSIIEASDGRKVAAIMSREVIRVMVDLCAFMLESSRSAASPTKLREYCTELGKRVQRRAAATKAGGFDKMFDVIGGRPQ
jgi:hypothetical protein